MRGNEQTTCYMTVVSQTTFSSSLELEDDPKVKNTHTIHSSPALAQHTQEDYSETLAFLNLVNALLTTLGPTGLPEGATGIAHYTQFVLQHVVGQLWQRSYQDPAQKWRLAAACFRHCQLVLDALASWPTNLGPQRKQGPGGGWVVGLLVSDIMCSGGE